MLFPCRLALVSPDHNPAKSATTWPKKVQNVFILTMMKLWEYEYLTS
jgi:hypothetical protein